MRRSWALLAVLALAALAFVLGRLSAPDAGPPPEPARSRSTGDGEGRTAPASARPRISVMQPQDLEPVQAAETAGRAETLLVRARTSRGQDPLDDLSFAVLVRRGARGAQQAVRGVRVAEGAFRLPLPELEDPGDDKGEPLRHLVLVTSESHGWQYVEYRRGITRELLVEFPDPAFLEVTVLGHEGSDFEAHREARIEAGIARQEEDPALTPRMASAEVGAEGKGRMGPVMPGGYLVWISARTEDCSFRSLRDPVLLLPGTNTHEFSLPPFHSLTVRFGRDAAGEEAEIDLEEPAEGKGTVAIWSSRAVDGDGQAFFDRLIEGRYRVVLKDAHPPREMLVTVPSLQTVVFQPRSWNAYRVWITDHAGDLAEAGFQDGDLIFGAGGAEFAECPPSLEALAFRAGEEGEKLRLMALRGSEKLVIEVAPKVFGLQGILVRGGTIEKTTR